MVVNNSEGIRGPAHQTSEPFEKREGSEAPPLIATKLTYPER